MARVKQFENDIKRPVLIITKTQLESICREEIKKGRQLLETPIRVVGIDSEFHEYNGRHIKVPKYDAEQFDSFKTAFQQWLDFTSEVFKQAFDIPNNEYYKDFVERGQVLIISRHEDWVENYRNEIKDKIAFLETFIQKIPLLPSRDQTTNDTLDFMPSLNKNKIFIVHGHDDAFKTKVARVVEMMGLHAIILLLSRSLKIMLKILGSP